MFLIFINDVRDIATGSVSTKLFADDLNIYTELNTACSSSDLQACLFRLQLVWAAKWPIDIAVDKCYTITYSNRMNAQIW